MQTAMQEADHARQDYEKRSPGSQYLLASRFAIEGKNIKNRRCLSRLLAGVLRSIQNSAFISSELAHQQQDEQHN
jgi:hypothetical protein